MTHSFCDVVASSGSVPLVSEADLSSSLSSLAGVPTSDLGLARLLVRIGVLAVGISNLGGWFVVVVPLDCLAEAEA